MHAFEAAGDPDRYPELGEPWQPSKLYYQMSFTLPRTRALHEAILESGAESPYAEWLANWDPEHDISHRVTTRVPCAEYFAVRDAALIAHATQIDPDRPLVRLPAGGPAAGLAHRGLRAGPVPGGFAGTRGRSVRRHPQ